MKGKNKKIILVIGCLLVVIATTFAFFVAQIGNGASSNVNVEANSVDDLKFEVDKDISLSIDQFNFASGSDNLSDQAVAKASLKANNTQKTATYNYYVYFNVSSNTYVYTTSDSKPEIVLTITNPNGSEVTQIDGLSYVSATNADGTVVNGFDITTYKGIINVAENYEISSNSSTNYTNQEWIFKVTFINLDSDQYDNSEGKMVGEILIQKEKIKTLAEYVISQYTGTQGGNNLYLHDSTLENGANDGSYRYAGSSETTNNFVCFGYDSQDGTCPTDYLYRIIGVFDNQVKLIKYDYAKASLLGTDGDYRNTYAGAGYSGTNKGSNTTSEIGTYYWNNNTYNNTWSESRLNTVNLNTNYLNNIGSKWSDKIATHTWKVGGNTRPNMGTVTVSTAYTNEITSPATNTIYEAKIGLMYVSDYGYAAAPSAWTTTLGDYYSSSIKSVNWMYMGLFEWTMAPRTDNSDRAFAVYDSGNVATDRVLTFSYAIRAVLYLKSEITYKGGEGTAEAPIMIN